MTPLTATRLESDTDLLDAAGIPDGFLLDGPDTGVSGSGTAVRLAVESGTGQITRAAELAASTLATVGATGDTGPLVAGVLPFRDDSPGILTLHQHTLRRDETGVWATELGPGGLNSNGSSGIPHVVDKRPVPTEAEYADAVAQALQKIASGQLTKVVLARTLEVLADRDFDVRTVVRRLLRDPSCYTFAAPTAAGMFVGASPESLLRRRGSLVMSRPLAGSRPRCDEPSADLAAAEELVASGKDAREHAIVVESVTDVLAPFCEELTVDAQSHLVSTASMWHLTTTISGQLRDDAPSALGLAAALHPTPAVCGSPTEAALEAIAELEPAGRGPYAGIVGWVDADGDGDWIVALRCAVLDGARARLFSGAGIVAGSDPWLEVAETEAKFAAMLSALRDS